MASTVWSRRAERLPSTDTSLNLFVNFSVLSLHPSSPLFLHLQTACLHHYWGLRICNLSENSLPLVAAKVPIEGAVLFKLRANKY
jgi:hypothetical protein